MGVTAFFQTWQTLYGHVWLRFSEFVPMMNYIYPNDSDGLPLPPSSFFLGGFNTFKTHSTAAAAVVPARPLALVRAC